MTKARIALIAVIIAGLGVGGVLYLRGSAPEQASLSTALPATGGAATDFDGKWTVVAGPGSVKENTATYAGYRIDEEFAGIGTNTAVGRTSDVTGTLSVDGTSITDASIQVDMTTLRSDREMRDNQLRRRGLETDRFPTATFALTEPVDVGQAPETGDTVEQTVSGRLTLHGVTRDIEVPLEAKWTGRYIEVVSRFDVALADYNIEKPTTARVRSIADEGAVEFHLFFEKRD